MDKITKSLVDSFSSENEIEKQDEFKRFEHFTNYSVLSKHLRTTIALDSVHTGGGNDGAIDGLAIIVNGKLIEDSEELEDIITTANHLDCDLIFVQSKTTDSFKGSEIGSFFFGVKDFLSDEPKLVQNAFLQSVKDLWDAVLARSSYMHNRRPNCWLYYVTTGKWEGDQNLTAVIDSGSNEILDTGLFEEVKCFPLGASEIQKLFHESKNRLSTTISFQQKITLPDIEGVTEAYLGILPYSEFIKLLHDESGRVYNIFDDNVRDFLGDNQVNKKNYSVA